jgi:peptide/nickel transport system permease protein
MWPFILRRVLAGIVILFIASFCLYVLVSLSGDPLAQLKANPHVSPKTIEAARHQLHLDEPLLQRYWTWFTGFLHGDFGTSTTGQRVGPQIWVRLGVTAKLVVPTVIIAAIIAVLLGVVSAVRQYSVTDHTTTALAYLFYSTPVFVIALLLKNFLAVDINKLLGHTLFYTVGENTPGVTGTWSVIKDDAAHTALPIVALVLVTYASWSRYQRAAMLDVLGADYIRMARAKGLSRRRVLLVHAARNALIPVTTVIALDFAVILGGTVITEVVFGWEGMGRFLYEGLTGPVSPDVNAVQAWLMITATAIVVFNIIADILYAVLDPRIRLG